MYTLEVLKPAPLLSSHPLGTSAAFDPVEPPLMNLPALLSTSFFENYSFKAASPLKVALSALLPSAFDCQCPLVLQPKFPSQTTHLWSGMSPPGNTDIP